MVRIDSRRHSGPGDVRLSLERLSIRALEWHPNFPPCRVNRRWKASRGKVRLANQLRGVDLVLFEAYLRALTENNQRLAEFLFQRFRPEFKVATEAWLKTRPLKNPSAPSSPFVMNEYSLAVDKEMQQSRQEEATKFTEARKANTISDEYLLLTVLFSVALFLGGITAAFKRRRIRGMVLALSVMTITVAAIFLAFLPLAKE